MIDTNISYTYNALNYDEQNTVMINSISEIGAMWGFEKFSKESVCITKSIEELGVALNKIVDFESRFGSEALWYKINAN